MNGASSQRGMSVHSPTSPASICGMQTPSGSTHGWREVAALLGGSMALAIALFAEGFAFFMWTSASVLWLAIVAIAGAFAGRWLLRRPPRQCSP
jgi:hypothetical protein